MLLIAIICFAFLGLCVLAGEVWAVCSMARKFWNGYLPKFWLAVELLAVPAGIALGCVLGTYMIQISSVLRTHGFPFFAGCDQLREGRWEDFVGLITFPAIIGNFIVGTLFPQLIFAAVIRAGSKPAKPVVLVER